MREFEFDLRFESWIPVRWHSGGHDEVGLVQLLKEADQIEAIDTENPLFKAAIIRILLAILHRALDGPYSKKEWHSVYDHGSFDSSLIDDYFSRFSDRFDLFHPDYPFFQRGHLVNFDKDGSEVVFDVRGLLPDAQGNDKTLFYHRASSEPARLTAAEAARSLVATQYFALAGLLRKTTNLVQFHYGSKNGPLVAGMPAIAIGISLFETLAFNLLIIKGDAPIPTVDQTGNLPVWERGSEKRDGTTTPHGYLDYLTSQSRHIRLLPDECENGFEVNSMCITQGVAHELHAAREPWFFYRESRKEPDTFRATRLNPDRSVWRDCDALLGIHQKENGRKEDVRPAWTRQLSLLNLGNRSYNCEVLAVANDQATPVMWRDSVVRFDGALLNDERLMSELRTAVQLSETVHNVLHGSAWLYARFVLGENPDKADIRQLIDASGISREYWALLDSPFRQLIARISADSAFNRWVQELRQAATLAFGNTLESTAPRNAGGYHAIAAASRTMFAGLKKHLGEYEHAEPHGVEV